MKVTGIISALIFAHVALGQATDSTSSAVSSVSGTKSANAATATTKTGTKSASASTSSVPDATPTGSSGSASSIGDLTESTTDPLIPTGISDTCSTFLNSLNSDTTVANCLASLNTALSAFTSGSGSSSAASKAVTSLCATNACATSVMRPKLTEFKDACSDELSSNDMIFKQYDTWYWLIPFKEAICTKDDTTQDYCGLITGSTASNSSNTRRSDVSYAAGHLTKRAQTVLMPNADTYRNSNLMYMFISPSMSADQLCTSCARKIMTKYTAQGYAVPYALGATKSKLLGQTDIWAAVTEKCPADFVSQIKNDAGVTDTDQLANGAVTTAASYFTALTAALAAAFAFF